MQQGGGADLGPVAPGPSAPDGGGTSPFSDAAVGTDPEVRSVVGELFVGRCMLDELLQALLSYPQAAARLSNPLLPPQTMLAACHAWVQAATDVATTAAAASLADSGVPLDIPAESPDAAPPAGQVR